MRGYTELPKRALTHTLAVVGHLPSSGSARWRCPVDMLRRQRDARLAADIAASCSLLAAFLCVRYVDVVSFRIRLSRTLECR